MVLDDADPDTWSAGSFFTNPVLPAADVPDEPDLPRWPAGQERVKLPAAWLIEHSGFRRGRPGPGGRVGLSTKHVLALSNRGGGTAQDILALAGVSLPIFFTGLLLVYVFYFLLGWAPALVLAAI